ncbi:MAG: 30S ribosome-binding factor RbfA [Candidatus Nanopelagicales bacterium]|jgi:ribosome-binding factor A|nr:30S ribosome-binding factor RbfA [Candidatus Nanopelagicales bacterium]
MGGHEARVRKLADRVKVIVAETLETRVKDPRLGFITITDARVTNDLREATVFYTVFGSEQEQAATAAALESAKGVLRTEVGRQTGVRHTPSLAFVADAVPENARHIDDLLAQAAAHDAAVAEAARDAEPAGEADPYRVPPEQAEEDLADVGTPGAAWGGAPSVPQGPEGPGPDGSTTP